jgi:hypothetical protein
VKRQTLVRLATGIFLSVVSLCLSPQMSAQSATTGGLAGSVLDPMGSAISGATIILFNQMTGHRQTTMTSTSGGYQFSLLSPGIYEVQFFFEGFKTADVMSVVVNVSEVATLEATLDPGSSDIQEVCHCRIGRAIASSTGTLVNSKTITAVPLTTRNFTQVLSMTSGSAASVNNAGSLGSGSQSVNVNGNTTAGTYTVDGAASGATVPNPDTISEFKIQTSQYDAGYGVLVPSTNLVTRSGENGFYGDLWEFLRNDMFNANAFFRKETGQPRPEMKQNQFGGTFGGPIKRDKLFFFGSYQGTRQKTGLDPTSLSTLILPPLTNDRSAATIATEFCPTNHILTSGPNAGQPNPAYLTFAGGKQLDCNNQNTATTASINPVALALLQAHIGSGYVIPTPQTILTSGANAGLGFSSYSFPSAYNEDQYLFNVDYVVSKKHTLSARTYVGRVRELESFGGTVFASPLTPNVPGFPDLIKTQDFLGSLKLSSVFTSNLANELRMTYTHTPGLATGPGDLSAATIGMTPVDPLFPYAPGISVLGSLGGFQIGQSRNEYATLSNTYSWADNLSWVHDKQTFRAGVFVYRQYSLLDDIGAARGDVTFQNFADFLVGQSAAQNASPRGLSNIQSVTANEGAGKKGEIPYRTQTNSASVFIQDDIKVGPRFTANFGLRWDYFPPSYDTAGQLGNDWDSLLNLIPVPPLSGTYVGSTVAANYNANTINPYTNLSFGQPPPGVFIRPGKSFYVNGAPLDTFAPRFGFAWQPGGTSGRVALRGGYGWFYQSPPAQGSAPGLPAVNSPPFGQIFGKVGTSNGLSTFQKPFPTTTLGFALRTPTSQLTDRVVGPVYRIPMLQEWNLNVQYSLSSSLALDLGYVGSYGNHLVLGQGLNQPLLASPSDPVNCGYDGNPEDCITTNTSANASLRTPVLGETPTALLATRYEGTSWYHSLQATLRQNMSRGLTFSAGYTFSKAETNTTLFNDQTSLADDWARASFDRTHRLIANYNYQFPTLIAQGWRGVLLKDWSTSGIVIIQSGLPMTLTDPIGGSVYGFAGPSTVTLCPGATNHSLATSGRDQTRLTSWFNTSAICSAPIVGSDGLATGYGDSGQSIVNGPGQFNTDFSIGKTFRVGGLRDDAELAFRAEFYNAFNHPQFSNPGTTLGSATFGVITQTSVAPRLIQFGLKYLF